MGTIADKLQLLLENKADIRAAIEEKGQSVSATAPLSAYGDKIRAIQTGADTSDATATAGDILSGKTAYVNGGKVTGAMPVATQATPSISVSSGGLITASATQEVGHVASGTKSSTKQLTTQGAKTVTPSTSEQTAVASGRYTTGAVKVAAMPEATQATPSISVSSAGLITASATQAAGYVAAGTKSATKQLTTQAAQTITPGTANKTIASGRYLTGTQTIRGDANLLAENIKEGVSIFGVAGSLKVQDKVSFAVINQTSNEMTVYGYSYDDGLSQRTLPAYHQTFLTVSVGTIIGLLYYNPTGTGLSGGETLTDMRNYYNFVEEIWLIKVTNSGSAEVR